MIDCSMLEPDDTRYVKKKRKKSGKPEMNNRYRDLKKRLVNGAEIGVIAIENQDRIDCTMPLRIMEYDCLEYRKQVEKIRRDKARKLAEQNL